MPNKITGIGELRLKPDSTIVAELSETGEIIITGTRKEIQAMANNGSPNERFVAHCLLEIMRLQDAIRNLRDVQGRHHTQIATERLFKLIEPKQP